MNAGTHYMARKLLEKGDAAGWTKNGGNMGDLADALRRFVEFYDTDNMYSVIACVGKDADAILGHYRHRFEAEWIAEGWNRVNGDVAHYFVAEPGEY